MSPPRPGVPSAALPTFSAIIVTPLLVSVMATLETPTPFAAGGWLGELCDGASPVITSIFFEPARQLVVVAPCDSALSPCSGLSPPPLAV